MMTMTPRSPPPARPRARGSGDVSKLKLSPDVAALNPEAAGQAAHTPSKYGNRRVTVDGYTFDSQAEYARFRELRLLARSGKIQSLQVHPRFDLSVNGVRICRYYGDFGYMRGSTYVVEDIKGARTQVYRIKRALMLACHGITITEIDA